jgi:hypothetical protein
MRMRLSLREGCQCAFDEKLDRSGLFRMLSNNGLAQDECDLKGCLLYFNGRSLRLIRQEVYIDGIDIIKWFYWVRTPDY